MSKQLLIRCSDRNKVLSEDKDLLQTFLKMYAQCGGEVNHVTTILIYNSISKHKYTVAELEEALIDAFESESFMNWANLKKHLRVNFNADYSRKFYDRGYKE